MPIIRMTRQDAKSNISFYKVWAVIFALLIGISFLYEDSFFIYHSAGLFLALVYLYFNYKALEIKGNVISKTVMSLDSLKGSLMLAQASFVGWLILSALLFEMILMLMPGIFIDTLFFFVFVLIVLYRRMRLLSRYARK